MFLLLCIQSYCLKLVQPCLKTAVSIGTVFPNKSYKEKYVINNWSYPEGTVKHPKKMQGERQRKGKLSERHKVMADWEKYLFFKSLYNSL